MERELIEISVGVLVVLFCLLRVPFVIAYQKSYQKQSRVEAEGSRRWVDSVLVIFNFICWVVLPLAWVNGSFTWADIKQMQFLFPVGVALYLSGLVMMWLANYYLKDNWSAIAELRKEHQLVQAGVYHYIRHPMYTAFYLQVFGLLLLTSNLFVGGMAIVVWQVLYLFRIEKEEGMLMSEFGKDYIDYSAVTGRLMPKL